MLAHLESSERMKPLTALLGRDATTISRQTAGLEQRGLVKRSRCPEDGRATMAAITMSGVKLVERTLPMTLALRKRAMKGIFAADAAALARVLSQVLRNLTDEKDVEQPYPAIRKNASGDVSRVLYRLRGSSHFSGTAIARRLKQPTRKLLYKSG